jgi:hypothetical protein
MYVELCKVENRHERHRSSVRVFQEGCATIMQTHLVLQRAR